MAKRHTVETYGLAPHNRNIWQTGRRHVWPILLSAFQVSVYPLLKCHCYGICSYMKTLKLVDIEISRSTQLCFAWLVLCSVVNYNTRFSGLTNTWLKSDPQML